MRNDNNFKKSATIGEFTIGMRRDGSIDVLIDGEPFSGKVKGLLRDEIAPEAGFDVDHKWTTRQLGSKLIDHINSSKDPDKFTGWSRELYEQEMKELPKIKAYGDALNKRDANRLSGDIGHFIKQCKASAELRECGLAEDDKTTVMSDLSKQVFDDINSFLQCSLQKPKPFSNERDLQMHLVKYLMKKYTVDIEYHVPSGLINDLIKGNLDEYPWKQVRSDKPQEMYVDIVVSDETEYVPIELKYKKKEIKGKLELFGKSFKSNYVILKNDGAQLFGRYGFWKDVRRIEFLAEKFDKVRTGIVVFVTNDDNYNKESKGIGEKFNMGDGSSKYNKIDLSCSWFFDPSSTKKSYQTSPDFKLKRPKEVTWSSINGFQWAIVVVDK